MLHVLLVPFLPQPAAGIGCLLPWPQVHMPLLPKLTLRAEHLTAPSAPSSRASSATPQDLCLAALLSPGEAQHVTIYAHWGTKTKAKASNKICCHNEHQLTVYPLAARLEPGEHRLRTSGCSSLLAAQHAGHAARRSNSS